MANRPVSVKPNQDASEMADMAKDKYRPSTRSSGVPNSRSSGIDAPFINAQQAPTQHANLDRRNEERRPCTLSCCQSPRSNLCSLNCCRNTGSKLRSLKRPKCSKNLRYYFSKYCSASSIHGVQYLGERGRFVFEKIFWTIVIVTVCSLCLCLISKTYHKWKTSPVIVTFSTTEIPISKIPFPAVTICPDVKFDPKVFNYTDVLLKKVLGRDVSEEEEDLFASSITVCDDYIEGLYNVSGNNLVISNRSVISDLFMAFPDLDPYNVSEVYWLGETHDLSKMVSLSLTSIGFCYSFNMLDYEDIFRNAGDDLKNKSSGTKTRQWSLESGYPNDKSDSYPRRTFLSGIEGGVMFSSLYTNHSHLDHLCTTGLQGFKVVLHHPSELPNMDKYFHVPLDQHVSIAITPRMTTVSEQLKSYKPKHRKCYFSTERPLKYFKTYSQQHCLDECFLNYTISKCQCVPFHMAFSDNLDVPTCGPGSAKCLTEGKVKHLLKEGSCNCLPFCTALEYNVEISQTEWNWKELFKTFDRSGTFKFDIDYKNSHLSNLMIFYKEGQFLATERHELYGYVDFFSNVGGLLGLFIGFSLTSFIEIIYFLTLRIGCNIRKYGRKFWSGEPELINGGNST